MKALKKRKFDFSQGSTLRRLLRYLGKQKILLLLSLLCALISALSSLYLPILTGRAVDCVAGTGHVDFTSLSAVLLQMALTLGAGALFQLLMNLVNNRLAYCVVRDLRRDCQEKVQRLPLSYLDGRQPGEILNRVISDAEQTANGLLMGLTQLFSGIVTILGTIALMLYMNAAMALAVIVPAVVVPAYRGVKKRLSVWDGEDEEASDAMEARLSTILWFTGSAMIVSYFLIAASYSIGIAALDDRGNCALPWPSWA